MRWIWIDRFTEFESGRSAVAVKCVSSAEDHLYDLFPGFPLVPHSLIVEGMAQTGGLLVGEAGGFKEKVVLAKITKAVFHKLVRPGEILTFSARVEQFSVQGASVSGTVTSAGEAVADIELMFSHVDQNSAGLKFPEHNFVFTPEFAAMLSQLRGKVNLAI